MEVLLLSNEDYISEMEKGLLSFMSLYIVELPDDTTSSRQLCSFINLVETRISTMT